MQFFGINVNLAGFHLRLSVGLDDGASQETPFNGDVTRRLEDLPRFQFSRD
jgi:hypothetical protein